VPLVERGGLTGRERLKGAQGEAGRQDRCGRSRGFRQVDTELVQILGGKRSDG